MKKIFNNAWFTLAAVVAGVVFGLIVSWLSWAWLITYFILWIVYAEKE